jgi:hypothetical protein
MFRGNSDTVQRDFKLLIKFKIFQSLLGVSTIKGKFAPTNYPFLAPPPQLYLMMMIDSTTPSSPLAYKADDCPVINNLTSGHIEFIRTFQACFDKFYMTADASLYGAQFAWVRKNVLGPFQGKFGPVGKDFAAVSSRTIILAVFIF